MKWTTNRLPSRAALLAGLCLYALAAHALTDATWVFSPSAGNSFNNPNNWMPPGVPTGTAFFGPTAKGSRVECILLCDSQPNSVHWLSAELQHRRFWTKYCS